MTKKEFEDNIIVLSDKLIKYIKQFLNDFDADDVFQEVIMKLWTIRDKLNGIKNINAYCYKMSRNHCLNKLNKKKYCSVVEEGDSHYFQICDTDYNIVYNETEKLILNFIKNLPSQQAEVMYLKGFNNLENSEISEITGLTTKNIRMILSRTRKQLRNELERSL